jgi:hypothetical protein
MGVVVDAGLLVALMVGDERQPARPACVARSWVAPGEDSYAPGGSLTEHLAEQAGTQVWTLDGPLSNNAAAIGRPVEPIT